MASPDSLPPSGPLQPAEVQLLAAIVASMVPILTAPAPQMALDPRVEREAAAALVQDITATALCKLADYLDRHAEQHRALEACIAVATRAAQCFAAQDFATAFALAWQGYLMITAARAGDPGLPPLAEPAAGFARPH